MEDKIAELKRNLEKNLTDWVRITQSEIIPLGISGIDLDENFEHEEKVQNEFGNANQHEGFVTSEEDGEGNREVRGSNGSSKNGTRGK